MQCGETQAGLRHQCLNPSRLGRNSSRPHSTPPSRVQVFTGGAPCQVVDSEEEPEDGEEEVGRPCSSGHACLALIAWASWHACHRHSDPPTGCPLAACCSWPAISGWSAAPCIASGVLHAIKPALSGQCTHGGLGCVVSEQRVSCRPRKPHSCRRGMMSCRLRSARGVAVLRAHQTIDFLRSSTSVSCAVGTPDH